MCVQRQKAGRHNQTNQTKTNQKCKCKLKPAGESSLCLVRIKKMPNREAGEVVGRKNGTGIATYMVVEKVGGRW